MLRLFVGDAVRKRALWRNAMVVMASAALVVPLAVVSAQRYQLTAFGRRITTRSTKAHGRVLTPGLASTDPRFLTAPSLSPGRPSTAPSRNSSLPRWSPLRLLVEGRPQLDVGHVRRQRGRLTRARHKTQDIRVVPVRGNPNLI